METLRQASMPKQGTADGPWDIDRTGGRCQNSGPSAASFTISDSLLCRVRTSCPVSLGRPRDIETLTRRAGAEWGLRAGGNDDRDETGGSGCSAEMEVKERMREKRRDEKSAEEEEEQKAKRGGYYYCCSRGPDHALG